MKALLTTSLLGLVVTTALAAPADAQAVWNRRVEAIGVQPSTIGASGAFDVTAVIQVALGGQTSAPLDLSTDVVFLRNTTEVARQTIIITADGGAGDCGSCNGGCGTGTIDGVINTLLCLEDQGVATPGCSCQFPAIQVPQSIPLQPGDEIMVLLMPAPGALPETDPADDQLQETHNGGSIYWDRRISSTKLSPAPGAPAGTYDLTVGWEMVTSGTSQPKQLDPQFEVQINLAGLWPPGFPAGFVSYYQWWVVDAVGPVGFAASNALSATTP